MKKIFYKIFIILMMFSVINVHAENIDLTKESTISVKYSYGDTNFTDVNTYLYKIASLNESGVLTYTDDFKNISADLKDLTTSELNALTAALDNEIIQKQISHVDTQKTSSEGLAKFNSLQAGVYLLKIDDVVTNDYRYKVAPTLIFLPLIDQTTLQYRYDVSVIAKTEAKFIGSQTGDGGNTTSPPNTVDMIMVYVAVFIICLLCIIGLIYYISKIKKDGRKENEKENN